MDSFWNSLQYLKPEIVVAITIVLLLLLDLLLMKHPASHVIGDLSWKNSSKSGYKNSIRKVSILTTVFLFGILITLYYIIKDYSVHSTLFIGNNGTGLIVLDSFSFYFKFIIVLTTLFIILFSSKSKELIDTTSFTNSQFAPNRGIGEYYILIAGMLLGMLLMVSSVNLVLLYVSIELLSLSSYLLVGYLDQSRRNSLRSSEAGLKYVIYGAASSGFLIFGLSLIYGITHSLNIFVIQSYLTTITEVSPLFIISILMVLVAFGFKISAVPFHFWAPDVYEGAPTTITAYLSVASKAAGLAVLIRFIYTVFVVKVTNSGEWVLFSYFDWKNLILIVSILTMSVGNLLALWQKNIKRLLAYSSIAHIGYMLAALVVMNHHALSTIMFYIFVYLFSNLGAFFIVIIIYNKIGSDNLDDYDGIGNKIPFLAFSLTVFLISLTGLPPTAGFIAKLFVFSTLVSDNQILIVIIALINTVISLYYYIRIVKHLYISKSTKDIVWSNSPSENQKHNTYFKNEEVTNTIIILLLLIPTIFLGVYFSPLLHWIQLSLKLFTVN